VNGEYFGAKYQNFDTQNMPCLHPLFTQIFKHIFSHIAYQSTVIFEMKLQKRTLIMVE
jgi:hypothetical protein